MHTGQSPGSIGTADVVIIGGGVIGLTIARALAQRGVAGVCVIEKNRCGQEASWAAGGILAPQVEADEDDQFFQLARASRDLYPDFVGALEDESGIDVGFDTTGTIYVGFTEAEETDFRVRFDWQKGQGLAIEWLTGNEVRRLEQCVSNEVRCALRFPNDYQIENRRLIQALLVANERRSVRLIQNCQVATLSIEGGRIVGAATSHGFIATARVVLAAGSWSSSIASSVPLPKMEVIPVRGQMLCFKASTNFASHVIYSARGYLIPRADGRLLAGSTTEEAGFDKRVTEEGKQAIRSMAGEIAPALASIPVTEAWAGLRPRTRDGLPVIGPFSNIQGLIYATGHYRNGILLAPITGELIAAAIVSGKSPPLVSPFLPDRFI